MRTSVYLNNASIRQLRSVLRSTADITMSTITPQLDATEETDLAHMWQVGACDVACLSSG